MSVHKKMSPIIGLVTIFVLVGTYNAVIINAKTGIQGAPQSIKRLDEIYGVTLAGRELAGSKSWTNIKTPELPRAKLVQAKTPSVPNIEDIEDNPASIITADMVLPLTEALNPTRWPKPLSSSDFQGTITTSNGIIENLSISLPGVEEISLSFAELTGNEFQYDYEGMVYSGLVYQADKSAFIVTLTNGPLGGTKLRFSHSAQEASLAVNTDTFSDEPSIHTDAVPGNPTEGLQANRFDRRPEDVL